MTTPTDQGHCIGEHVRDDGTLYYTVEAWVGETYLSLEITEAVPLAIELTKGIKELERKLKHETNPSKDQEFIPAQQGAG